MFIPLHDANSLKHIKLQYVTFGLIAANVIVFLMTGLGSEEVAVVTAYGLGYIPAVAFGTVPLQPNLYVVPENLTYITYAFIHADIFHLGGNMLFLWVFGDNVEDALGHIRYLIFYFACAVAGALFHGVVAPSSEIPLIGASGAIAGVVAAYLMLHPKVKIWILAFSRIPLLIPAWIALALWIIFQFAMFAMGGEDQISWSCHVGGIIAGALLVLVLRSRNVPLFDAEVVTPRSVVVKQPSAVEPAPKGPVPRWGRQ